MKKYLAWILTGLMVVIFSSMGYADPPGLSGKGGAEFPKGLEQHEKTPSGWNHGEKEGWEHHHHHHQEHHHHHHHHKHKHDRDDR